MRRLLMMLPILLLAGQATGVEKHMVTEMTCEQVKAALQSEGKALMRWHSKNVPGLMRYGMYHAGRQMCRNQAVAHHARYIRGVPPHQGRAFGLQRGLYLVAGHFIVHVLFHGCRLARQQQ